MRRVVSTMFFLFVLVFSDQHMLFAQKVDTIYHINGDVMTGDFKKLLYGITSWSMTGMGTMSVEDVKINTIKSRKLFEIKVDGDLVYFGSFDTSGVYRHVNIVTDSGSKLVSIDNIDEVYPIKRNFWMRTSGNFSLGANYSKSSNVASIVFSGNLNYKKKKSFFELSWTDNNSFQADTLSSSNSAASFAWQRLLKKSWSAEIAIGASQNTEMGTKLRLTTNLVGIRDIFYNKWNRFYAGAGLNITSEEGYDDPGAQYDLAGLFQLVWRVFKYSQPKVWVNASIDFLPYITNAGRYRVVTVINPKTSILNDNFQIGFDFYFNYDSNPPEGAASTNDYGVNLQLSYSFH